MSDNNENDNEKDVGKQIKQIISRAPLNSDKRRFLKPGKDSHIIHKLGH